MRAAFVSLCFIVLSGQAMALAASPLCIAKNLQPIMDTHKLAAYPPRAVQLNETGNVLLRVVIGPDGVPIRVSVIDSSGFEDLDVTSVDWVKATWRWKPLPTECQSIETRVAFKWSLSDIGRTFSSVVRIPGPGGAHLNGRSTTLDILISETGELLKTRVVNSSGDFALDSKAADALKLHKFQPGLVDGHPATSAFVVQIDW